MNDSLVTYIISAPSGTGKTTLNRRLTNQSPSVAISISYTARKRRPNETDGIDYHFISDEDFRTCIKNGKMLEYAEVFGTFYGTSHEEIERIQSLGKSAILEIDVQGWMQAKSKLKNTISIFILPPSIEILWQRLERRGTESHQARLKRLMTARGEIQAGHLYDFFIVNNDVDQAYQDLYDIVINKKSGKISHDEGVGLCEALLREFDTSPWLRKLSQEFADM